MSLSTPSRRTPSFSADAGVTERTAAKAATRKARAMMSSRSRRHDLGGTEYRSRVGSRQRRRSRLPCLASDRGRKKNAARVKILAAERQDLLRLLALFASG